MTRLVKLGAALQEFCAAQRNLVLHEQHNVHYLDTCLVLMPCSTTDTLSWAQHWQKAQGLGGEDLHFIGEKALPGGAYLK